MLLEVIIYVPKLDPSLSIFSLDFLHYYNHWLWEFIFQEKVKLLHIKPDFASGTPCESHWHLFKGSELKSLKLLESFKSQFLPRAPMQIGTLCIERPLQLLQSAVSSSQRGGIISLSTSSGCAKQHSPWDWSRWHHVGERKQDRGHCCSALHEGRSGLRVHNTTRNFFFSPPLATDVYWFVQFTGSIP